MTIRIWEIPSRYPNKHMGVYQDPDPGYEDLRFRAGRYLPNEPKMVFDFHESQLEQLHSLGCLWTNIGTPLINNEIVKVLNNVAPAEYQLVQAKCMTQEGSTDEFHFLNVTSLCDCLDLQTSTLYHFDNGAISGVKKLRFKDDGCMNSQNLARLKELKSFILVSQKLFEPLSKLKFKGLQFMFDRDGDDYR